MSPKDKKFVNPLLRSTEPSPEAQVQTPIETTQEAPIEMHTHTTTPTDVQTPTNTTKSATTYTSNNDDEDQPVERRKRGKQAFDKVHMRWTLWINKKLKKRIDQLAKREEISLVALAEEAFADLLKKYESH